LSNYNVTYNTALFSITPISLTAAITAADKAYDGTRAATITACTLATPVIGDDITCTVGSALFSQATVGAGLTVTGTGITLAGTAVGNYTLPVTTTTTTADINKAPPTITLTSTPTISMPGDVVTFTATLLPDATGTVDFTDNGNPIPGCTGVLISNIPPPPTAICAVSDLTAGSHIIRANYSGDDNHGAAYAIRLHDVGVNTNAPTLILSTLSDGAITANPVVNVSGVALASVGDCTVTINGIPVTVNSAGAFSYPVTLGYGANILDVVATDSAGRTISVDRTITLNPSNVGLVINYPSDNSVTSDQNLILTGNVADGSIVTYTLNGGNPQQFDINGTYITLSTLPDSHGINTIEVTAVTPAGDIDTRKVTIIYDPAHYLFSLAITDPAADIRTNQPGYLLKGSVDNNLTPVTVQVTMDGQNYTPPVTSGTFEQQLSFDTEKVHTITVTATDENNNTVSARRNINYVIWGGQGGNGDVTIIDALNAYLIYNGKKTATAADYLHYDVAPLGPDHKPLGDGKIDIADVIMILRKIVGAENW